MVRSSLDDTKTQTRRVCKPQFVADALPVEMPATDPAGGWVVPGHSGMWWCEAAANPDDVRRCPYGQPGDRLWVREAWMPDPPCDGTWGYTAWAGSRIGQIAAVPERFQHPAFCNYRASWLHGTDGLRWTPGIHMPRWASRITLEVTGVRVERLQDISESDAIAEGIERAPSMGKPGAFQWCDYRLPRDPSEWFNDPVRSYQSLWEQINGPGSWASNPWVWVVEFKRLEAAC